jgi:hypothetical protein
MGQAGLGSKEVRGRRRIVGALSAAVVAYWAGLAVVALRTPVQLFRHLRQQSPGHATMGYTDRWGFAVTLDGHPVWQSHVSLLTATLWIAGPPLLLWLAWLITTGRRARARRLETMAPLGSREG